MKLNVLSLTHNLDVFGYKNSENASKYEITVRVKSLLSQLKLTGNIQSDFTA